MRGRLVLGDNQGGGRVHEPSDGGSVREPSVDAEQEADDNAADEEPHVPQVSQELHARVAPQATHEIRVRPGAEGSVPLLHGKDEAARARLPPHKTVSSRAKCLCH